MVRISVDLPDEVADALARTATEIRPRPAALLADAARRIADDQDGFAAFVADREAFDACIAEGDADVAAGRVVPAEGVFAELNAIIAAAKARKAQ